MPVPHVFTNVGSPAIDANQVNDNFNYIAGLAGGARGKVTIPADFNNGTTVPTHIPFATPFATSVDAVIFGKSNYTGALTILDIIITDAAGNAGQAALDGMYVVVIGGEPGSHVDVHFAAFGT